LIVKKDTGARFRSIYDRQDFWTTIVPPHRLKGRSIDQLRGLAWVGWQDCVKVLLGTQQPPIVPHRSRLTRISHVWKFTQYGKQFGLSGGVPGGAFTANAQLMFTHQRVPVGGNFTQSKVLSIKFDRLFESSVFIYDDDRKTAWLCPAVNLIVHTVRLYLSKYKYHPSTPNAIPFPEGLINADYGQTKSALQKSMTTAVEAGGLSTTYGDIFNDVLARYQSAFRSFQPGFDKMSSNLIGFELLDILEAPEDRQVFARELALNDGIRSWRDLALNQNVVFCSGLGEVIRPFVDNKPNPPCALSPPRGRDLLIAPVCLLQGLVEELSGTIYQDCVRIEGPVRSRWQFNPDPFRWHSQTRGCNGRPCGDIRLQTTQSQVLKSFKIKMPFRRGPKAPLNELPSIMSGALCFGNKRLIKRLPDGTS
jgi:hypothetical protein